MHNIFTPDENRISPVVRIMEIEIKNETNKEISDKYDPFQPIKKHKGYQNLDETIIDLDYIKEHGPCLEDHLIIDGIPDICKGVKIKDICLDRNIVLNHRIWLLYISIYYRFRLEAIKITTSCASPGHYTDLRKCIYANISSSGDHLYMDPRLNEEKTYTGVMEQFHDLEVRIISMWYHNLSDVLDRGVIF